jgi:L-ribulose-5-phosphate 3-epimerase
MRLSTSTNFFAYKGEGEYTSYIESMKRCKAAGFNVLDANFCSALNGKTDLAKDNWQEIMTDIRNEAEKLGVEFSQSHPVFIPGSIYNKPPETMEIYKKMMERSIIASSILGVKWAVLHPIEEKILTEFDMDANIRANFKFFASAVELAKKNNVGVAFENMLEKVTTKRRFSSHAGELVALVDAYNDPGVGACWDFGHGNLLYKDQRVALRTLGKRLKATHVDDNYGLDDDHMFPFHGTVDWHSIMPVLREIGYEGDFTYEAHKEFYKLPEAIKDSLAKVAYEIGVYCLSLV